MKKYQRLRDFEQPLIGLLFYFFVFVIASFRLETSGERVKD